MIYFITYADWITLNTWTSTQGKIDISLNNLIPHTRGDAQKSSLPLNQLLSPTSPTSG
ncbi:unnamed protein product, partial [Rotaria magnacalcarata]